MKIIMRDKRVRQALFLAILTFAGILAGYINSVNPSQPTNAKTFHDVPVDHWAYSQIMEMTQAEIVSGYNNDVFRPGASVSYGAFSLMLARAFYSSDLTAYLAACGKTSADTEAGRSVIGAHGILNGTRLQSGEAHLSNMLTRDDMAVLMFNILIACKAPLPGSGESSAAQAAIKDFSSITPAWQTAITTCYALELLTGRSDGSFGPRSEITRAQAAVVLSRLLHYIKENQGSVDAIAIPVQQQPEIPSAASLPEFAMRAGENAQAMMNRINAGTRPYVAGQLTNGKPITADNIREMLELFKDNFPDGTPWEDSDFYRYNSPSFGSVRACSAFAAALSDSIFGEDAPIRKHQDFNALKPGDVIWLKNIENGYWHALLVIAVDPGADRFTACSGNHGKTVCWSEIGRFSILNESSIAPYSYVFSRY